MALVEWKPFEELDNLQDKINRLFDKTSGKGAAESGSFLPATDIYSEDNNLVIETELPGVRKEDVDIKIEDNTLTIKGKKEFKKEDKGENYYRVERSYGSFSRSFMFPDNVEREGIKAEFKNGLLKLILPKKPEAKAKNIDIEIK